MSILSVLRAARRRRNPILGAVILALATAAPVGIAGNEDPVTDPVAVVSSKKQAEPVVLQGTVEPVPATPLTGITSGFVLEWLVKDGALVKEGDALYRELRPGASRELADLRAREQAAALELKNAEQAPPPDFRAEQDAADRAAAAHAEAVRSLQAAEAEGTAVIKTAEDTLLKLQAFGDPKDVRAYAAALQLGKLHHQTRMSELGAKVTEASRLMDDANSALAWKRYETQKRMAELQRAPGVLAAEIRRLESGIAQGRALHDGVIRIRANRVPEGAQEAERVVGELLAPGFVLAAPAGSRLPDLMVGASALVAGSEFACERTELVSESSTVRCLVPGVETVAAGTEGELRLPAGGR